MYANVHENKGKLKKFNWKKKINYNITTKILCSLVESVHKFITSRHQNSVPLCINVASPSFKSFQR